MAIKRRQATTDGQGAPVKLPNTLFQKTFKTLWEFLSAETYEDGSERRLPTVTIFLSPTGLQACLNDRDQGMAAFVTSTTVDGLWAALEKGLEEDSLDWRRSVSPQNRKKGK